MTNPSSGPPTAANIASPAADYLRQALTMIQTHSLHRQTIDWTTLFAETWRIASGANEPQDTYPAIAFALRQINDGHSFFWPPEKIQAIQTGAEDNQNRQPTGHLRASDIAYLYVPSFMGSPDAAMVYARTLQQIIADLDATDPIGWVVDLTDNTGGNMWPMIVGLGPLFDVEEMGAFVDAAGRRIIWRYVDGQGICGDGTLLTLEPPVTHLRHKPAPIAVLTGPSTISSGEMVAIAFRGQILTRSFGQPTRGLPTAIEGFELRDGAQINLTIAVSADRTGQRYDTAVKPDVVVAGDVEQYCLAAIDWLRTLNRL